MEKLTLRQFQDIFCLVVNLVNLHLFSNAVLSIHLSRFSVFPSFWERGSDQSELKHFSPLAKNTLALLCRTYLNEFFIASIA
jgi:hypothetical protein